MSRTMKMLAVGAAALGLTAGTTSLELASRHQTSGPAGPHLSLAAATDHRHTTGHRHTTVLPRENRHGI